MRTKKTEEPNFVRSVGRALKIMEFIAKQQNEASLTEISSELELGKSTVHGLLYTLGQCGYVKQLGEKGKYSLDLKLFELGQAVQESLDVKSISTRHTKDLLEQFGETVQLGVLSGGEVIYLDKLQGLHTIGSLSKIGARLPSYCTGLGKVLLSQLPEEEIRAVIREEDMIAFTENTITTYEDLFQTWKEIRQKGYALDNEEIEIGLRCVAAPVYNNNGKIVAAVSISGPTTRIKEENLPELISGVQNCARKISSELGYQKNI